ncbi:MAG: IS200/IS605 family transposase [Clostridia bacterium]|nr:IS200/IS605 family transposase [Clostridia bacterium]
MTEASNTTNSLAHTKWNCKYHIIFAPKYRRKVFFEQHRSEVREILRKLCEWKGVEIIEGEVCKEYVANQLKADKEADQLSIFDPRDPLTGGK